jgi:putative peptidoglycan lipid II flippase
VLASPVVFVEESSVSTGIPSGRQCRVFGDAALIGVLTSVAKLAGAAKVTVTARFFGNSDTLDAFLIAFLLPSFLSDVVAGSFTPSLIPLLVRAKSAGAAASHRLLRGAVGFALAAMLAAGVGLGLAAPWLLPLAGSSLSADKLHLATALFFGLLFWLPMSACLATWKAVLNANGFFALPAVAPVAAPLVTIALLFVLADRYGVAVLCVGTVGGAAMESILIGRAVRRMGFPIKPAWLGWSNPEMLRLRRQYFPLAMSAVISSACVLVDQSVAGRLGPGRVSVLVYGNKLAGVLLAVAASAAGTAALPLFTRMAAAQDWKGLRRALLIYSGTITLLMVPLAAGLISCSSALVRAFFQHGAFQADATTLVTQVQRFALLQVPFAMLLTIATRLTAALSLNALLVRMGCAALIADILLDLVFSREFGVAGIALATPCVQCVSLCVLVSLLRRHQPRVFSGGA